MGGTRVLDSIERDILRVLSLYEHLTPLQLWYELGEDDTTVETMTEQEILRTLESLKKKGFVARIGETEADNESARPIYRLKTGDVQAQSPETQKGVPHGSSDES